MSGKASRLRRTFLEGIAEAESSTLKRGAGPERRWSNQRYILRAQLIAPPERAALKYFCLLNFIFTFKIYF